MDQSQAMSMPTMDMAAYMKLKEIQNYYHTMGFTSGLSERIDSAIGYYLQISSQAQQGGNV